MKFKTNLEQLAKAVQRLEEVLEQEKNDFMRDSAIQRFEFCTDLSWKTLQSFLKEEKGLLCNSPKDCFKKAYSTDVIEYDIFYLYLIDLRNITSHTYHEKLADEVYMELGEALESFEKLVKILSEK